ncbi:MAG: tetratricopeptide repeat protein [Fluviicola sp.]|nr:tetratricopeptide repeat protein [Fluviicola sp.]
MFANEIHKKAEKALKEGNIEKAISLYTKALKKSPNNVDIISDRGVAYLNLNKEKECFSDLDLAITLQPEYAYRYACRAFAKRNFGNLDGAILDYEKAIELDPSDSIAHNNMGLLLEQKGYKDEAEKRFKTADKLSKAEDGLLEMMDELEGSEECGVRSDESEDGARVESEEKEYSDRMKEFKKVFTSTEQLKEFLGFIKNGFKIR